MMRFIFYFFIFFGINFAVAQNNSLGSGGGCAGCLGTGTAAVVSPGLPGKGSPQNVANGNEAINTSYTATACGLNYVSANFHLNQRNFSSGPGIGVAQPASFIVSGIPTCGKILKALLYSSCESDGTTVINASITNPLAVNAVFPMSVIGTGASKCWSRVSSLAFRADITSIISGNGTYLLSGFPVDPMNSGSDDVNGATLFIIYTDETVNYTGSIVIADGMYTNRPPSPPVPTPTITGFNVCGPTLLTTNFMIIDDMQQFNDCYLYLNSSAPNYTVLQAAQYPWMLVSQPGNPAVSGTTSAVFGADGTPGGDCLGIIAAGMYYRTNCLTCPNPMTLTVSSSTCVPTGTASVVAVGGSAPLTYTWSGSVQTTSAVTGLSPGTHTVRVADANSCKTRTTTVNIISTLSVTATSGTCLPTFTASALAAGGTGPYTYVWSGSAATTSLAAGLSPGPHTVTVSDFSACQTKTAVVNVTATMSITANSATCTPTGSANVVTTGGIAPYTYAWTGSAQTTSLVTNLSAGLHTVTVSDVTSCQTKTTVINITTPSTLALTNTVVCIGYSTTVTAVGSTNTYTWNPPGTLSPANASLVTATPLSTTIYTVTNTNSLNCIGSGTVQVFEVLTQTVPIANPTTCVGQNLLLLNNASYPGSTYIWTGPLGFNSNAPNPTITPAALVNSGSYSLTVYSAPGCTSSAVSNATVFALPVPGIVSNGTVCSGVPLTLNGSGAATYTWSGPNFSSVVQNTTIASPITSDSGVYTLTAAFANGCSSTATRSVLIRPLPSPTITVNNPVCRNGTLTLQGTGGTSYSWKGPNAFTSFLQNPNINNVQLVASGIYTLIATLNTCTNSTTQPVTINPLPVPTATNNSAICANNLLQLSATAGVTYTWAGPAAFTSTLQQPAIVSSSLANNGVYTVTVSDINTCKATALTTVTILPNPAVTITGTNVCLNAPGTLTLTGGVSWAWTGPNGFTSFQQNPSIAAIDNITAGGYSVVVTAANNCTTVTSATMSFVPLPSTAATSTIACLNAITTLTASGAATYTWTGPNAYFYVGQYATIPSANNLSSGTYTILGRGANSCTQLAVASLTTMPLPSVTASGNLVCLKTPAQLFSNGSTDVANYSWTGPLSYTSNAQNPVIPAANSAVPVNYTVQVIALNTCTMQTVVTLSTHPLPTVTATGTLICKNEPFVLTATGAGTGGLYAWTGPHGNSTGASVPLTMIGTSITVGNYTVIGTDANTCSNVATARIDTLSLPNVTAVGSTVCIGKPAVLVATGAIGYSWTGPNNYFSTAANALIPITTSALTQTYTVVGVAPNTCTNSASVFVDTHPLPQPTFTAPARVCFKSTVDLKAAGAATYTWSGPYAYYAPGRDVTFPIFSNFQQGTYTLSVTDNLGCTNFTTTFIKIDPNPTGKLISDNSNNYCAPFCSEFKLLSTGTSSIINTMWFTKTGTITGQTFNLCVPKVADNLVIGTFTDAVGCTNKVNFEIGAHASPVADYRYTPEVPVESADLVFFNDNTLGNNLVKWDWFFLSNKGPISTGKNITYTFDNAGSYPVAMVVTNNFGCSDTVVKTIIVESDFKLFVPNSFSPNGDGVNDTFQPKGRGLSKYTLTIYDRWGTRIFHTSDFETGWDGEVYGSKATDDVFVWKINAVDVNGKVKELMGHVTLSR